MASKKWVRPLIWLGVIAAVLLAFVGIARATDRSIYCGSSCHEMKPNYAAWQQGPHAGIDCIECHVEPGFVSRLEHKAVAMKELWAHLSGDPKFPLANPTPIPNERCVRCHPKVRPSVPGFDHAVHARGHNCQDCHATVGHAVTSDALRAAGILNEQTANGTTSAPFATTGKGKANIDGHKQVMCSRCHDMAATGCATCHQKHGLVGAKTGEQCVSCHPAGAGFAFTHPAETECADCHTKPSAKHDFPADSCASCHRDRGVSWKFTHPSRTDCEACHARPAKHRAGSCYTCHRKPGVSWAFSHPGNETCTNCHSRPAGHRSGGCTTCHRAGVSWAFRHPSGQTCTNCHNRPSGHRSGACSNCHRAGVSWAFRHPSGVTCTNCHTRPAGHSSGACSNCHKRPGVSWAFSHPRIPGGEHTYRSFACAKCHPNGYSTHSCHTTCHGGD